MPAFSYAQAAVLAVLVAVAAVYDVRERRIPNWLCLAGFAAAFAVNLGWDLARGAGLALSVYLALFLIRAMGGGDLKLMVAAGALAGPSRWLLIFCLASILGGVVALAMIAMRRRLPGTLENIAVILGRLARGRAPHEGRPDLDVRTGAGLRLPHGVPIAVGTWLALAAAGVR